MKKFLVTYHGGGPPPSDPEMAKKMREAFGAWLAQAGKAVVDPGAPIRPVGQVAKASPLAQVEIGGYSILQGESFEAIKPVLAAHPFVARGGTLQVCEAIG